MEQERDFFGGVLKIALGIALGVFIFWFSSLLVVSCTAAVALKGISDVAQDASRRAQVDLANREAAQRMSAIQQRQQQQIVANQRAVDQRAALRRQAIAQSQAADLVFAKQEAERSRQQAWAKFYQPSAKCLSEASVECGNAYIRAQRDFDRTYIPAANP